MPQVGEIELRERRDHWYKNKKGEVVRYKSYRPYIYISCENCKKERWVIFVKSRPQPKLCKFCTCSFLGKKKHFGETNGRWKGGRITYPQGYIVVRIYPDDFFYPMARGRGYLSEHRLVMAKHLGRCLHRWELVHHKGIKYPQGSKENRADNRIENLQLISDDRHKQITILELKIKELEKTILLLKENKNGEKAMETCRLG